MRNKEKNKQLDKVKIRNKHRNNSIKEIGGYLNKKAKRENNSK